MHVPDLESTPVMASAMTPTTPSHKKTARVGGTLGMSGGTIIGIALFFTWVTFVPVGCRVIQPPETQTGWDMLTIPNHFFNERFVIIPVVLTAVVIIIVSIRAWIAPTTITAVWSGIALIVTSTGTIYFTNLAIAFLSDSFVLKIFPGFYMEFAGLALALGGAILCVVISNPLPPDTMPARLPIKATASLMLGLGIFGLLTILAIANGRWAVWGLLGIGVFTPLAIIYGRSTKMASRRAWWVGRFGELLGYTAITIVGYFLVAFALSLMTY